MGLINAAAIILATQGFPDVPDTHWAADVNVVDSGPTPAEPVSQDRLDEIWTHVENRVEGQVDLWFDDGEFPTVVSILKVQVAYDPDNYESMTNLGWMQENIEQYGDAEATYREFIRLHPTDGEAPFPLGWMYYNHFKKYDQASVVLEGALKLNPGPNTYRILAKCYERQKKYSDAVRVWELQLKRWPGEPAALANISRVKAKMSSGGK